jgi:hypothetical protein
MTNRVGYVVWGHTKGQRNPTALALSAPLSDRPAAERYAELARSQGYVVTDIRWQGAKLTKGRRR